MSLDIINVVKDYPISIIDEFRLKLSKDASVLGVEYVNNKLLLHVLTNNEAEKQNKNFRTFRLFASNETWDKMEFKKSVLGMVYVNSFKYTMLNNEKMYHLFELVMEKDV